MANPFNIEPASFGVGMQNLMGAVEDRAGFEREKAKKVGDIKKREEAMDIYKNGTAEDLQGFMIKNPGMVDEFDKIIGFKNKNTKQNMIDSAKRMLLGGEEPSKVLIERAEGVLSEGGDPTGTVELAKESMNDPEAAKKKAEKVLALYDNDSLKAYRELTTPAGAKDTRTTAEKNYDRARLEGYEGSFVDYEKGAPVGKWQPWGFGQMRNTETGELKDVQTPPGRGETIRTLPGGGIEIIRGDGGGKPLKFSEVQAKTGGFATRVEAANSILTELEDTIGFDAASISEAIKGGVPVLGNILSSEDRQVYNQAKGDFITAVLRLESGAAISPTEFEKEDKKYFPQPGDGPQVIANKRKARERQFRILKGASGGAYDAMREAEPVEDKQASFRPQDPQEITTQEAFDQLPSGAIYMEDGKQYRKP